MTCYPAKKEKEKHNPLNKTLESAVHKQPNQDHETVEVNTEDRVDLLPYIELNETVKYKAACS